MLPDKPDFICYRQNVFRNQSLQTSSPGMTTVKAELFRSLLRMRVAK